MKILAGAIGAITGALFGAICSWSVSVLLSRGNVLLAGALTFVGVPLGGILGAISGIVAGLKVLPKLRKRPDTENEQREKTRLVGALLFGVPAAFLLVIFVGWYSSQPPSDRAMLRHFERNETVFNKIIEMANVDKALTRVDVNWTLPQNPQDIGVSPERLAEYRKLLATAGTPRGFQTGDDGAGVDFYFWLVGSAITSDVSKGFSYQRSPPANVLQTLDGYSPDPENPIIVYRHIRGNWYLFYEYIPG